MGTGGVQTVVSADGTRIASHRSGRGEPLVMIHGTSADRTRWAGVLPMLESQFTVYAVDRRGRGGSADQTDYALERECEDVTAVLESIGEPLTLLGHSYGAICALEAALTSAHVRRLILYEPPIPVGIEIYEPGMVDRLQARLKAGDDEGLLSVFITEVVRAPAEHLELMRSLPTWPARLAAAHTVVREVRADESYVFAPQRWSSFETPTLLLLGGDSPGFFTAATTALDAALPSSTISVLARQQHAAMDTAPRLFVQEILRFVADT
jgi:pimeloyl-ACP methyl ester carboxylesterase